MKTNWQHKYCFKINFSTMLKTGQNSCTKNIFVQRGTTRTSEREQSGHSWPARVTSGAASKWPTGTPGSPFRWEPGLALPDIWQRLEASCFRSDIWREIHFGRSIRSEVLFAFSGLKASWRGNQHISPNDAEVAPAEARLHHWVLRAPAPAVSLYLESLKSFV